LIISNPDLQDWENNFTFWNSEQVPMARLSVGGIEFFSIAGGFLPRLSLPRKRNGTKANQRSQQREKVLQDCYLGVITLERVLLVGASSFYSQGFNSGE